VILASESLSRRTMLEKAGISFTMVAPNVDEALMKGTLAAKGLAPDALALALAEAKALSVSEREPGALVLGGDQVLVCDGALYTKALDAAEAEETLRALRGRTHRLISAAVLAKNGATLWQAADSAVLRMRDFSDAFLADYLAAELPDVLGSVGCYRIEGRGAQLFSAVAGDQFTIRGLPLFAVLDALRAHEALHA
jgi:septum formation protein